MKRILSLAAMAMMVLNMSAQMNVWKDGQNILNISSVR